MGQAIKKIGSIVAFLLLLFAFAAFQDLQIAIKRSKPPPAGMAQIELSSGIDLHIPSRYFLDTRLEGPKITDISPGEYTVEVYYSKRNYSSKRPVVFSILFVEGHRYKFQGVSTGSYVTFWVEDTADIKKSGKSLQENAPAL